MKKKCLTGILIWVFCMVIGVCCVTAETDGELKLIYTQDYEVTRSGFTAPSATNDHYEDAYAIKTDETGNKYLDLTVVKGASATGKNYAGYSLNMAYGDINFEYGVVVRFDICKMSDGAPIFFEMNDYENDNRFAYVGFKSTDIPESNVWYAAEIRYVDRVGGVTLWNKETGEKSSVKALYCKNGLSRQQNSFRFIADMSTDYHGNYVAEGYTVYDTHYGFDNINVYGYTPYVRGDVMFEERYDNFENFHTEDAIVQKKDPATDSFVEIDVLSPLGMFMYNDAQIPSDNFRVTFDIKKMAESASFNFEIHTDNSATYVYLIPAVQLDEDVWYTYRIERTDGKVKAYRRLQTCTDYDEIKMYSADEADSVTAVGVVDVSDAEDVGIFGSDDGAKPAGSVYAVDNVLVENINSAKVTAVMEASTIHLYSDIFGSADEQKQNVCKAILVCYDKDGVAFDIRLADVSATEGKGSVAFDIARADDSQTDVVENATFTKVKNGGSAKVFFWKDIETLFPLTCELNVTELFR